MLDGLGVPAGNAWDTSRPWIPKKRHSSRSRRPTGVFAGSEGKDFKTLAAGTAQNIVGLVVFVVGTFAANILISRAFGAERADRARHRHARHAVRLHRGGGHPFRDGHGVGALRRDRGRRRPSRPRATGRDARGDHRRRRCRVVLGALTFALAGPIGRALGADTPEQTIASIRAAAVAIPFVALTYVWLGGSRGLKVMRHTLYVQWVAQPLLWIVLMLVLWRVVDKTEAVAVWAYAGSWIIAALGAWFFWGTISRRLHARGARARA